MPSKNTRRSSKGRPTRRSHRIEELTERVEIVLPEVTARIAALEHLLLELKLCSMQDLRRAREFVKTQEE